jgi:TusA-related sulfurtransferase
MTMDTITQTLDLRGLACPMPIAKTAQAMRSVQPGDVVEALATDPGSVPDFDAPATSSSSRARMPACSAS